MPKKFCSTTRRYILLITGDKINSDVIYILPFELVLVTNTNMTTDVRPMDKAGVRYHNQTQVQRNAIYDLYLN